MTLTWLDPEGRPVASEIDPEDTYDPTARPWFAAANRGETWTSHYVFFSSRAPGVTAAAPVTTDGGLMVSLASTFNSHRYRSASDRFRPPRTPPRRWSPRVCKSSPRQIPPTVTVDDGDGGLRFMELGELLNDNTRSAFELIDSSADLGGAQTCGIRRLPGPSPRRHGAASHC